MASDDFRLYTGGARHTARQEIAGADIQPRKPNYSMSNPAFPTQEWSGTSSILTAAGRRNRKRPGGAGALGGLGSQPVGPLSGLADSQAEIIGASGLGKKAKSSSSSDAHDGLSAEEAMNASDADPERPPTTGNMGGPETGHPLMATILGGYHAPDFFME